MAFQDVYELVDEASFQGQKVINVYFYQQNNALNPGVVASDLVDMFLDVVMPNIREIQVPALVHTELRCRNIFNDSDNHVRAVSLAGTSAETDNLATFNAVGYALVQDNGAIKNGSKRFAGIGEGYATDGIIDNGGAITNLDNLGDSLEAHLFLALADIFRPVVVGRILSGGSYVLPDTLAAAVIGMVTEAVWNAAITSQTSRKIGNGE